MGAAKSPPREPFPSAHHQNHKRRRQQCNIDQNPQHIRRNSFSHQIQEQNEHRAHRDRRPDRTKLSAQSHHRCQQRRADRQHRREFSRTKTKTHHCRLSQARNTQIPVASALPLFNRHAIQRAHRRKQRRQNKKFPSPRAEPRPRRQRHARRENSADRDFLRQSRQDLPAPQVYPRHIQNENDSDRHRQLQNLPADLRENQHRREHPDARRDPCDRSRMASVKKMPLLQRRPKRAGIALHRTRPSIQQPVHGVDQPNHQPKRRNFRARHRDSRASRKRQRPPDPHHRRIQAQNIPPEPPRSRSKLRPRDFVPNETRRRFNESFVVIPNPPAWRKPRRRLRLRFRSNQSIYLGSATYLDSAFGSAPSSTMCSSAATRR